VAKPHLENKTGTNESYKPIKFTKKGKDFKKYELGNLSFAISVLLIFLISHILALRKR
jgi:hypothetical protein